MTTSGREQRGNAKKPREVGREAFFISSGFTIGLESSGLEYFKFETLHRMEHLKGKKHSLYHTRSGRNGLN